MISRQRVEIAMEPSTGVFSWLLQKIKRRFYLDGGTYMLHYKHSDCDEWVEFTPTGLIISKRFVDHNSSLWLSYSNGAQVDKAFVKVGRSNWNIASGGYISGQNLQGEVNKDWERVE